jgi:outer membrane protein assembly factor BamB
MKLPTLPFLGLVALLGFCGTSTLPLLAEPAASNPALGAWMNWRGPLANGVAPLADPPVEWSETRNVRWKVPVAGKGHSSPILVHDRVIVVSAVPVGEPRPPVYDKAPGTHDNAGVTHRHQFVVQSLHRKDGSQAWRTVLKEEFPHEGGHVTGSLASNSPISDGERLYVFLGSRGLHCLDLGGKVVWQRELGRMDTLHAHGEGSSPVLHGDLLLVCWDHEGDSFLYAFDKRTGEQRWRTPRDEKTSWSTPLIVEGPTRTQVVVSATRRIRGYDVRDGSQIWECAGLTDNVVSSPVHRNGIVVAGNSYYSQAMVAIRLEGAKGDVTGTDRVAWQLNRLTPYVSSPLLYGNTLYFIRHNQNVLSRLDPDTGRHLGEPLRLDGIRDFIFSSPVGAADRIYVTARDGTTVVLRHDRTNAPIAFNHLDDVFSATAAVAGTEFYLRGERFLYCIAR